LSELPRSSATGGLQRARSHLSRTGPDFSVPVPERNISPSTFNQTAFITGQVDTTFIERNWSKG